jgi:CheY-like chemotaxis protein
MSRPTFNRRAVNGKKVLLAGENVKFFEVLQTNLRDNFGYEAVYATTPTKTIRLAISEQPDILVLSEDMHGMTGVEIIERIRGDSSLEKVPVILLTEHELSAEYCEEERLGIVAVFTAPFSSKKIREKIDETLL